MRHLTAALLPLTALMVATPAHALPAPKTDAEMTQLADLVVDGPCVMIACNGKPTDDGTKVITRYRSTVFPSNTYKGGLPNSLVIEGEDWKYHGATPTGGWHQEPVPKGWSGKMYLQRLSNGAYTKVWWNALVEDTTLSKPLALPSCLAVDGSTPTPDMAGPDKGTPTPDMAQTTPDRYVAMGDDPMLADLSGPDATKTVDAAKTTPDSGQTATSSDSGCAVAGHPGSLGGLTLSLLLLLALGRRRRR